MTETNLVLTIKNASQNISANFLFKGSPLKKPFSMTPYDPAEILNRLYGAAAFFKEHIQQKCFIGKYPYTISIL
jgi:hypothetical protein